MSRMGTVNERGIILRHDYKPNGFTLFIYKPFSWEAQ